MQEIAALFDILARLEKDFGLNRLSSGERAVFDFIASWNAIGIAPSADEILAADTGSRASVYRALSSLKETKLIEASIRDGQPFYSLGPKLNRFSVAFAQAVRIAKL